jgi:SAM-dependent methyltransferase
LEASVNSRLQPTWFDHQRHPLVGLRRAIEGLIRELPLTSATVVDLGCGDSPYRPFFAERGARYVRCDLEGVVDVVLRPGEPIDLPEGRADGVVSFQVLEHVWDLDWYLGEARRLLRDGGWLLLSTHGVWPYHPHPTDFRRWTRDGLVRELEGRGFAVEKVQPVCGPLAWSSQVRLLGLREILRRIPLLGWTVLPLAILLWNLRMILEDAITPASMLRDNASVYVTLSRVASRATNRA